MTTPMTLVLHTLFLLVSPWFSEGVCAVTFEFLDDKPAELSTEVLPLSDWILTLRELELIERVLEKNG
jgi:hypothetical protein